MIETKYSGISEDQYQLLSEIYQKHTTKTKKKTSSDGEIFRIGIYLSIIPTLVLIFSLGEIRELYQAGDGLWDGIQAIFLFYLGAGFILLIYYILRKQAETSIPKKLLIEILEEFVQRSLNSQIVADSKWCQAAQRGGLIRKIPPYSVFQTYSFGDLQIQSADIFTEEAFGHNRAHKYRTTIDNSYLGQIAFKDIITEHNIHLQNNIVLSPYFLRKRLSLAVWISFISIGIYYLFILNNCVRDTAGLCKDGINLPGAFFNTYFTFTLSLIGAIFLLLQVWAIIKKSGNTQIEQTKDGDVGKIPYAYRKQYNAIQKKYENIGSNLQLYFTQNYLYVSIEKRYRIYHKNLTLSYIISAYAWFSGKYDELRNMQRYVDYLNFHKLLQSLGTEIKAEYLNNKT